MDLFIGNLPPNVNYSEIVSLFRAFSRMARFRIEQKTLEDGSTIRFVVAEFDNDKQALKLMKKFQGQLYRGRELLIREYYYRSYSNERRAVNWREKPWRAGERRRQDRRNREPLSSREESQLGDSGSEQKEEKPGQVKIEAYDNFVRKD